MPEENKFIILVYVPLHAIGPFLLQYEDLCLFCFINVIFMSILVNDHQLQNVLKRFLHEMNCFILSSKKIHLHTFFFLP